MGRMGEYAYTKRKNTKRIIGVVVEGKNKTERLYLNHFKSRFENFSLNIIDSEETDALNMVKRANRFWKENDLSYKHDHLFVLLDIDANLNKYLLTEKLQKEYPHIDIVTSNPCIEVWYLLHYRYTTQYMSSPECIKKLRHELPNYSKNKDIYNQLMPNFQNALDNLEKLKEFHSTNNDKNPFTEIDLILQEFQSKKDLS